MDGIKQGSIKIKNKAIRFAAANGLNNARELLKEKDKYHFIEIMACPGGCIGGGGQPLPVTKEIIGRRMEAIYKQDKMKKLRCSHENPVVQKIYKEYLGKPLSRKAHNLLHTKYIKRSEF